MVDILVVHSDPEEHSRLFDLLRDNGYEVVSPASDHTAAPGEAVKVALAEAAGTAERKPLVLTEGCLLQALLDAGQQWTGIFDALHEGIAVCDLDGTCLLANKAMCTFLGTSREHLVGSKCSQWIPDASTYSECVDRAMQGSAVASCELQHPDNSTFREVTVLPLRDDADCVTGVLHIYRDLTQRREIEQRIQQQEKLAAVSELISGVAHEMNNPLMAVIGYAQLLQMRDDLPPAVQERLAIVVSEAHRCSRIVQNLLAFAVRQEGERPPVNLNLVLDSALDSRSYQLRDQNIRVVTQLDPELPLAQADFNKMQQVVLNLMINAEQSMAEARGGGTLTLTTRRVYRCSDAHTGLLGECGPDTTGAAPWVQLEVADDGPGIPADLLPRVFDPFVTTREVGKGTGLGLAVCYGTVREHGGRIYCRSEPGRGARFFVELPALGTLDEEMPGGEATTPARAARILVVDDDAVVGKVVSESLLSVGHEVTYAASGEAGLEDLVQHDYDLVVCDLRMPGISGSDLYERVKAERPEQARRFLFLTGDSTGSQSHQFLVQAGRPYLTKPVDVRELQRIVAAQVRKADMTATK